MKLKILLSILMLMAAFQASRPEKILGQRPAGVTAAADQVERVPLLADLICADAGPMQVDVCRQVEAEILASTVRIELHVAVKPYAEPELPHVGHATIKDGRYLVTHNHFPYPLAGADIDYYQAVSLHTAGSTLLHHAPMTAFTVAAAEAETLLLEFTDAGGAGLFEALGLPSARFADWRQVELQPEAEVAQINWDGRNQAFIDWRPVDNVMIDSDTPRMEVRSLLKLGASGGGVFNGGVHVGNNWTRSLSRDNETGQITRIFSTAALNPPALIHQAANPVPTTPMLDGICQALMQVACPW